VPIVQNRRYLWFAITIVVGLVIGLSWGWNGLARKPQPMPLEDLRFDYKADYVLMVAQYYQQEGDLATAREMLDKLGEDDLTKLVKDALDYLNDPSNVLLGADIRAVNELSIALQASSAINEGKVA
jgi:hypothetical protein